MDFSFEGQGLTPLVDLGVGPMPQPTFLEYNYFAYQIKGNQTYNNMVANILPLDTYWTLRSKIKYFLVSENSHIAYQSNKNEA